jgi:hypothetical protein
MSRPIAAVTSKRLDRWLVVDARQAREVERFLDRHWNAVYRPPALAAREGGIGGASAFSRLFDLPDDNCVQHGTTPFRAWAVVPGSGGFSAPGWRTIGA